MSPLDEDQAEEHLESESETGDTLQLDAEETLDDHREGTGDKIDDLIPESAFEEVEEDKEVEEDVEEPVQETKSPGAQFDEVMGYAERGNVQQLKAFLSDPKNKVPDPLRVMLASKLLGEELSQQQADALLESHYKPGNIDKLSRAEAVSKGLSLMRGKVYDRDQAQLLMDAGLAAVPVPRKGVRDLAQDNPGVTVGTAVGAGSSALMTGSYAAYGLTGSSVLGTPATWAGAGSSFLPGAALAAPGLTSAINTGFAHANEWNAVEDVEDAAGLDQDTVAKLVQQEAGRRNPLRRIFWGSWGDTGNRDTISLSEAEQKFVSEFGDAHLQPDQLDVQQCTDPGYHYIAFGKLKDEFDRIRGIPARVRNPEEQALLESCRDAAGNFDPVIGGAEFDRIKDKTGGIRSVGQDTLYEVGRDSRETLDVRATRREFDRIKAKRQADRTPKEQALFLICKEDAADRFDQRKAQNEFLASITMRSQAEQSVFAACDNGAGNFDDVAAHAEFARVTPMRSEAEQSVFDTCKDDADEFSPTKAKNIAAALGRTMCHGNVSRNKRQMRTAITAGATVGLPVWLMGGGVLSAPVLASAGAAFYMWQRYRRRRLRIGEVEGGFGRDKRNPFMSTQDTQQAPRTWAGIAEDWFEAPMGWLRSLGGLGKGAWKKNVSDQRALAQGNATFKDATGHESEVTDQTELDSAAELKRCKRAKRDVEDDVRVKEAEKSQNLQLLKEESDPTEKQRIRDEITDLRDDLNKAGGLREQLRTAQNDLEDAEDTEKAIEKGKEEHGKAVEGVKDTGYGTVTGGAAEIGKFALTWAGVAGGVAGVTVGAGTAISVTTGFSLGAWGLGILAGVAGIATAVKYSGKVYETISGKKGKT